METKVKTMVKSVRTMRELRTQKAKDGEVILVTNNDCTYIFSEGEWTPRIYFSAWQASKLLDVDVKQLEWTVRNYWKELNHHPRNMIRLRIDQMQSIKKILTTGRI